MGVSKTSSPGFNSLSGAAHSEGDKEFFDSNIAAYQRVDGSFDYCDDEDLQNMQQGLYADEPDSDLNLTDSD